MNNHIFIKITTRTPYQMIKTFRNLKINIYNITYNKDNVIFEIDKKNYPKIQKNYHATVIKGDFFQSITLLIKNKLPKIISLVFFFILISIYQNFIIKIDIITEDTQIRELIQKELLHNDFLPYHFKKSASTINKLKNKIINNNKDQIEWLNIEQIGMKYQINVEPKVTITPVKDQHKCHIIARKDATITKIISSKGEEVKEINDNVKKGDIIINGTIKLNEQDIAKTCATGHVYGKTWYTVHITTTKTYEKIIPQTKIRYNLLFEHHNQKNKIFRSRLKDHLDENKKIFSFFGYKLLFQKEHEISKEIKEYTPEELDKKVNELINAKIKNITHQENSILDKKVLKKEENNSTISIDIFIVAEEEIGQQVIITEE